MSVAGVRSGVWYLEYRYASASGGDSVPVHGIFKSLPPVGAGGGYMFSGRPSVRACVRTSVRASVRP